MIPSTELVLSLYRTMIQIREFELKARELLHMGKLPAFIHVYVGEEAIAAGVSAQLRPDDYVLKWSNLGTGSETFAPQQIQDGF